MSIDLRFIITIVIFILTLVFGFWLSNSGKPYNGVLFNIHKLLALAVVILMTISIYNLFEITNIQILHVILIFMAILGVAAMFFSGAMLSTEKLRYEVILAIHKIATVLLVLVVAAMVYRLHVLNL